MAETVISRFIEGSNRRRRPAAMNNKITRMLFNVLDELNQMRPEEERLAKGLETALAGDFGRLDSAGLINLIVLTEQKAAQELGRPILLTDDRTMSQINKVFRTVGSLADYILLLLDEKRDG
jgi:acyl carrier protein